MFARVQTTDCLDWLEFTDEMSVLIQKEQHFTFRKYLPAGMYRHYRSPPFAVSSPTGTDGDGDELWLALSSSDGHQPTLQRELEPVRVLPAERFRDETEAGHLQVRTP
jgi:hypothetical protein